MTLGIDFHREYLLYYFTFILIQYPVPKDNNSQKKLMIDSNIFNLAIYNIILLQNNSKPIYNIHIFNEWTYYITR